MKVIDLHCDALNRQYNMVQSGKEDGLLSNTGHVDLCKLEKGDYLLQCFAVYVNRNSTDSPLKKALEEIDLFYRLTEQYPDRIAPVTCWNDIQDNMKSGKICAMLTVESGDFCTGSIGILHQLYRMGARIMSLTWNYPNDLAFPNHVPDQAVSKSECAPDNEHGLTARGFEFLEEMERMGMIADVSHLADAGFWDICRTAKKPFIATHSNARALSSHPRNLTDDMLRAIADHGGIAGINYFPPFLDPHDKDEDCFSSIEFMIQHISHIKKTAGIDVIALGSDFDGIGGKLELENCGMVQKLADSLSSHGFSSGEVEKIFHGNALRLFRELL